MIATTTVAITTVDGSGDPYEVATTTLLACGVPAHIGQPSGRDAAVGGDAMVIDAVGWLWTCPDVPRSATLTDEATEQTYAVAWSQRRRGLGLDHLVVGLRYAEGASNG